MSVRITPHYDSVEESEPVWTYLCGCGQVHIESERMILSLSLEEFIQLNRGEELELGFDIRSFGELQP